MVGGFFGADLGFIPSRFGAWEVHAGAQLLLLGGNLEQANQGDDLEFMGGGGISIEY